MGLLDERSTRRLAWRVNADDGRDCAAVHDVEPQLPRTDVQTLAQTIERDVAYPRRSALVVASFSIVALLLAGGERARVDALSLLRQD